MAKRIFLVFSLFTCLVLSATGHTHEKKESTIKVVLETDLGKITAELYSKKAPITVENFLKYVDSGFYNGTIFHRVIPGFMAQGGGYTFDFQRKEALAPIKNESDKDLKNIVGTLSMARLNDPDSATAQFFINVNDNESLDRKKKRAGYAVFGKVIEGYDVVKKIEKEPRGIHRAFSDAPNYPVRIVKAYRLDAPAKK